MSAKPTFSIVLHAHIPYVLGHGRWPHGTDWLCEAAVETYLPLHRTLRSLLESDGPPGVTLGMTPILCEQLASARFQEELGAYLDLKIEAAQRDVGEFRSAGHTRREQLAEYWTAFYGRARREIEALNWDLVAAFRELEARGAVELLASAATHGYLPLIGRQSSLRGQLQAGVSAHRRHFGREPRGIWLPECAYRPAGPWQSAAGGTSVAYRPGLEDLLSELGYRYFVVDTHLVSLDELPAGSSAFEGEGRLGGSSDQMFAAPPRSRPRQPEVAGLSPYRPYGLGGLTVFARDPRTSRLVWSASEGYPGAREYLEFHKRHHPGGLRYWKVTDRGADLAQKDEYDEAAARALVRSHAQHFVRTVEALAGTLQSDLDAPTLVAPYDAELFGHWWLEGVGFLEEVLRGLGRSQSVDLATLGDVADRRKDPPQISLPEGSWGEGGYHDRWVNADTRFVWRAIYESEAKLENLVRTRADRAGRLEGRVLRQLARSLLLLEASDWPFLISSRTAHDYAERRVRQHHDDFQRLYGMARHLGNGGAPSGRDLDVLEMLEQRDEVFPDVDPAWWR